MTLAPRRVVLVGGGGHARVLLDIIGHSPDLVIEGYVAPERSSLSDAGVRHLGDDGRRAGLAGAGVRLAVLGVAGATGNARRRTIFADWVQDGFEFVSLVHPAATLAQGVVYGDGLQCFAGAVVNPAACLGRNVIINTNATVEHDCQLGDHVHVAPGATICGGVRIGAGALIGAGAVVVPGVKIGCDVLVAAGSVVTGDLADGSRVAGVPARSMMRIS
jgi:UDP-perosamine 4-acetyltransferase